MPKRILHGNYSEIVELIYTYHSWHILYGINYRDNTILEMPNISFASGGDSDKLDFVAYVAKDRQNVRSCYVLECSGGLSQDVITTIGQAFELRLDAKLTYLVIL